MMGLETGTVVSQDQIGVRLKALPMVYKWLDECCRLKSESNSIVINDSP